MATSAYSSKTPRYTSGSLPLNEAAVKEVIHDFKTNYSFSRAKENSYINARIAELEKLYDAAIATENQFYEDFLCFGATPKEKLNEFQSRLDYIAKWSGIDKLTGLNFYKTFMSDPAIMGAVENHSTQAIQALIEKHSDLLVGDLSSDLDKLGVIDALNDALDHVDLQKHDNEWLKLSLKTSRGKTSHFRKSDRVGIAKYLIEPINNEEGKWEIKFSDQSQPIRLDPGVRDKILGLLSQYMQINILNTVYSFREYINNIIRQNVSADIIPYFEREFRNLQGYALNKNENVIKGYVEEISQNVIFSYLSQNNQRASRLLGSTLPTGAIKDLRTGQSIPIDMILGNYGFQIKSWSVSEGIHTEENTMGVGNFVINGLQLNYYDALIQLFGTYQFNQLYNNAYESTANQLNNLVKPGPGLLQNIFNTKLDSIIRLNRKFSSDMAAFGINTTYSNTFFIVNGKLVPGSSILQALINAFKKSYSNSTIINFEITEIKNQDANSLPELIETGHRNIRRYHMNVFDMSNLVKLSYKITLNIDNLIQQAYNEIVLNKN